MGWLGKFGHFVTNSVAGGVRRLGHLGGEALNQVGILKHSYDNINNSVGGVICKTIEGLPIVGGVLGSIGKFLNNKESLNVLDNTFKRANIYGEAFEHMGKQIGRIKGS